MDEMNMLCEHHDAQPAPSPDVVRAARARLAARTRSRRLRLPRLGRLALGAGALGVALAVGLVAVQVVNGDGRSGGVLNAKPASATEVLDNAAAAARHRPDPRPGQFVYTEALMNDYDSGINPDSRTKPGWQDLHFRSWVPVDGKQNGLLQEKRIRRGEPVKKAWSTTPLSQPGGGPLDELNNYLALNRLPRDPDKLLAELHRRYPAPHSSDPARDRTGDEKVFDGIQGLVTTTYLPPSLRAALFEATEKIPGITLVKDSTDAAGRHGIAVALTFKEGISEELIFDRRTYAPLGSRRVLADASAYNRLFVDMRGVPQGQVLSVTALLNTKIVERPGQLS